MDRVQIHVIKDLITQVAALKAGEIDMILSFSPEHVDTLKAEGPDAKIMTGPETTPMMAMMKVSVPADGTALSKERALHPIFGDVKVRKALGCYGAMKVIMAIGIVRIPIYARLVRGSVLSIKEKEYIEACRAVGQRNPGILLRHILPNCMTPIIVTGTLSIATAIIVEASLSFLGLGTQPPTPSWGWDLKANVSWIQMHPWLALAPGCAIFITVLGFNLFGDGLRDALDPRLK